MRRRDLMLLAPAVLAPALLAACASPDPLYFTLAVRPGPPAPGGPKLVELRRIGLAGYLDRPEIVRNDSNYRLHIPSGERWGEPLGDMFARVLAEDLNQRLPGGSVFTSAGAISAHADAVVEIDVQRFDADGQGQVLLAAQVAVSRGNGRSAAVTQSVRLVGRPAGATTTDLVAEMSVLLGQLADRIAPLLRALR